MQDRTRTQRPSPRPAAIRVELGRSLAAEADSLCRAAEGLCDRLHAEFGALLIPPVFLEAPWLRGQEYRILYGDSEETGGRAYPGRLQALGEADRLRGLAGRRDTEPMFGQPCVWIPRRETSVARAIGVDVAEVADVVTSHLELAMRHHLLRQAARDRVEERLAEVERCHPTLLGRVARRVGREQLHQVLHRLAGDGIPLGDLRFVLERLAAHPCRSTTPDGCAERLRVELKEAVCRPLARQGKLACITLHPDYQAWLFTWQQQGADRRAGEPWLTHLARSIREAMQKLERAGEKPALLCIPSVRPVLARVLGLPLPGLRVLKTAELDPTLQLLDRVRIDAPGWRMQASRWIGYAMLGGDDRRQLKSELEEYQRCLRRRTLPLRPGLEPVPPKAVRRPRTLPGETRRTQLTPLQKAAVLLLECPTWVLREVLSRLQPAEISRLGREMTRMGRQSPILREQVLKELPGGAKGALELGQLMAHLRGLLEQASRPETVLTELGLCLSVLPDASYHAVAGKVFAWLRMEAAEDLRGELAVLRSVSNPVRAARAVERFTRFYRGGVHPLSLYGNEQLGRELQRAVLRNPQAMALALERLWLRPENHRLDDFVRWCEESPNRAARWLVRWAGYWTPSESDPDVCARAALDGLPLELAAEVRRHLAPELRHLPRGESHEEPADLVRQWLSEYYLQAYPDCPAAELSLN